MASSCGLRAGEMASATIPCLLADDETLTFGEMEPKRKYAISHRTRAFAKFKRVCLEGGE